MKIETKKILLSISVFCYWCCSGIFLYFFSVQKSFLFASTYLLSALLGLYLFMNRVRIEVDKE